MVLSLAAICPIMATIFPGSWTHHYAGNSFKAVNPFKNRKTALYLGLSRLLSLAVLSYCGGLGMIMREGEYDRNRGVQNALQPEND